LPSVKSKPASVRKPSPDPPKPAGLKRGATVEAGPEDDADLNDPYPEPRQRPDGKYDCNHACHDKTSCKHLCCREGLDKPPRRKAKSAAVNAGKSVKKPKTLPALDKAHGDSQDAQTRPLRLPPKPSSRVSLFKASGSRTTTTAAAENTDEEDESLLPSLDTLMSQPKGFSRRTLSTSNRLKTPPRLKGSYLDLDKSPAHDGEDEVDQLLSSPSPPAQTQASSLKLSRPKKRLARGDEEGSAATSARKRGRLSLREFASSSSLELDSPPKEEKRSAPSPARAAVAVVAADEEEPLFRSFDKESSPEWSLPTPTAFDFSDPLDLPKRMQQDQETAPLEEGFEPLAEDETRAETEAQSGREEDRTLADEDDDFDAWLERNVVVV
ncbi:hypothetical protein JCM6882_007914, partial [Rhodosporidiobolus microsporus]